MAPPSLSIAPTVGMRTRSPAFAAAASIAAAAYEFNSELSVGQLIDIVNTRPNTAPNPEQPGTTASTASHVKKRHLRPSTVPSRPNQIGNGHPGQGRLSKASTSAERGRASSKATRGNAAEPDALDPGVTACQWDLDNDDCITTDDDGYVRSQRRGGGSKRGRGGFSQGAMSGKKKDNPFVEYEDREKRLQQERKWLQEDPLYMEKRTSDLRQGKVQKELTCRSKSPETLFDARVLFGPYSTKIRERKERSRGNSRAPSNQSNQTTYSEAVGKRASSRGTNRSKDTLEAASYLKGLQRSLKDSTSANQWTSGSGNEWRDRMRHYARNEREPTIRNCMGEDL